MSVFELLSNGLVYALVGALAGILAGVLGIGGGVIVVPGLLFFFNRHEIVPTELSMQFAAGTSLAIMILNAQSSLRAHLRIGEVLWPIFKKLWPGLFIGSILGALLADKVPTYWLKLAFALFLLFVAFSMLTHTTKTRLFHFPSNWFNYWVNFTIGVQSGLLGIGGGLLIVPYLTYCGVDPRKIAAITNVCTLTVALIGTTVFMITGLKQNIPIPFSTGYVYWPAVLCVAIPSTFFAPIGARLSYSLPIQQLKYGFVLILIITAISLFL